MKCGHSRNLFYVSRSCFSFYLHTFVTHLNNWNTRWDFIFFDIWKLLVAYKHTYFAQRNRMTCGHSRNIFYVSRSCFSFYLHTFVTRLNTKYALRFHFYSTFLKLLVAYKHTYFAQHVVIVGIYFTCLEAVFHFLYTLFWRA